MSAEIISIAQLRRRRERLAWDRQRQEQISAGRARLRQLLGVDWDGPEPPRAA